MKSSKMVTALILNISALFILLISFIDGLPYGYFTLLRLVVCISSIILFYAFLKYRRFVFSGSILVGLIYNPIIVIHLERYVWKIINSITISYYLIVAVSVLLKLRSFERSVNTNTNIKKL